MAVLLLEFFVLNLEVEYFDMADNDIKDMRGRIRTMVRDIDRCISMLKVTQ